MTLVHSFLQDTFFGCIMREAREMAVAISPIKAEKQGAPDNLSLALSLSESQAVTKFVSQSGVVVRQILTDTRELRDVCSNR
jgi:hypothetical protein